MLNFNKTKANLLRKDTQQIQQHFGFRKFSIGLAGALLSSTFLLTGTNHAVHAADLTDNNNDPDTETDQNKPDNDLNDFKTTDDLDQDQVDDVTKDTTEETAHHETAKEKRAKKLKAEKARKAKELKKQAESSKQAHNAKSVKESSDNQKTENADNDVNSIEQEEINTKKVNNDKSASKSDTTQSSVKSNKDTIDLKSREKSLDKQVQQERNELQQEQKKVQQQQKADQARLDQIKHSNQNDNKSQNVQSNQITQNKHVTNTITNLHENHISAKQADKIKSALEDNNVQEQLKASTLRTQSLTNSKETTTNLNDNKSKLVQRNSEAQAESNNISISNNNDPENNVTRTYTINYRYPQDSNQESYSNTYTIHKQKQSDGTWIDNNSNLKTTKININTLHIPGYKLNSDIPADQLSKQNGQTYVSYLNDEHGDVNDPNNLKPSFNYTVNYKADDTNNATNTFNVNKLSKLFINPAIFNTALYTTDQPTFDHSGDDTDSSDDSQSKDMTRIITIHKADGTTQTITQKQTVTELSVDKEFSEVDLRQYVPDGYQAYADPDHNQILSKIGSLPVAYDDDPVQTEDVWIAPAAIHIDLKFYDDTLQHALNGVKLPLDGQYGETKIIKASDIGPGYVFADGSTQQSITLTDNANKTIHLKEVFTTITHDNPVSSNTSIPNFPNSYYPDGLDTDDLNRTLTRTIVIYYPNSYNKHYDSITQTLKIYRDAKFNPSQPDNIKYTAWQVAPNQTGFAQYVPETVDGYAPIYKDKSGHFHNAVPALTLDEILHQNPNISEQSNLDNYEDPYINIGYTRTKSTCNVSFVDIDTGHIVGQTIALTGKPGTTYSFKDDNRFKIPDNYQLTSQGKRVYDAGVTLSTQMGTTDLSIPVEPKTVKQDDATYTYIRKFNVTYPDEYAKKNKNGVRNESFSQVINFRRSKSVNAVTGEVTYGKWQYQDPKTQTWITSDTAIIEPETRIPKIPGYRIQGDEYNIENYITAGASPNETYNVTYIGDAHTGTIHFVDDDEHGKIISNWQFAGRSNSEVEIHPPIPANYELAKGQQLPTKHIFSSDTSQDEITVHLKHKHSTVTTNEDLYGMQHVITRTIYLNTPEHNVNKIIQTITFTRTGDKDDVTENIEYSDWNVTDGSGYTQNKTDGKYYFNEYKPPMEDGYKANIDTVPSIPVTAYSDDSVVTVSYGTVDCTLLINYIDDKGSIISTQTFNGPTEEEINFKDKLTPPKGYAIDYSNKNNSGITSLYTFKKPSSSMNIYVKHTSSIIDDTKVVHEIVHYQDQSGNQIAPDDDVPITIHRQGLKDDVDPTKITYGPWRQTASGPYDVKPVTGYHLAHDQLGILPSITFDGSKDKYERTVKFNKDAGQGNVLIKYVNRQGEVVTQKTYTGTIGNDIIPDYQNDLPSNYEFDKNARFSPIYIQGPTNNDVIVHIHKPGEDTQQSVRVAFVDKNGNEIQSDKYYGLPGETVNIDYTITGHWKVADNQNLQKQYKFINGDNKEIKVLVEDTTPPIETGTITVNYVDDDANGKIVATQTLTAPVTNFYTPDYHLPDGYKYAGFSTPPYDIPLNKGQNKPVTVHVEEINKKVPQKENITVYYIDDLHGWTIKTDNISGDEGQTVNVTYSIPKDYTEAPGQNLPTTYKFSKDNPDIKVIIHKNATYTNIQINYVDSNTNSIVASETVKGALNTTLPLHYNIPAGYELDQRTTPDSSTYVTNINPPITVYIVKHQVPSKDRQIKINYEDEHGWIVGKGQIVSGTIGQTVNLNFNVPKGYSIDSNQPPVKSYTFKDKDNTNLTVHVITDKKMVPITINYVDSSNNNTVKHETVQGAVGTTIPLNYNIPAGYEVDQRFAPDTSAYVTNVNSPITIYIVKHQVPSTDRQIKISFEDEHGWIVGKSQTVSGKIGQTVNLNYNVPDGYSIDSNQPPIKSYTFKDKDNTNLLVHVISNKKMMPITINYVDTDTNSIVTSETVQGALNTKLPLHYNIPAGYELDQRTTPDSSTYVTNINPPITVYIVKHQVPSTDRQIKINYEDEHGWIVGKSQTVSGEIGQTVTLNYNIPDGYSIDSNQPPIKSYTFKDKDNTNLTVHVISNKKMMPITINYVNTDTNSIVTSETVQGALNTNLPLHYNIPAGYELDQRNTPDSSTYVTNINPPITVYIVKHQAASNDRQIKITYEDEHGWTVGNSQIVSGKIGQTVNLDYQVPDGYSIDSSQPPAKTYTFKDKDNTNLIVHVVTNKKMMPITINFVDSSNNNTVGHQTIQGALNTTIQLNYTVPAGYEIDKKLKPDTSTYVTNVNNPITVYVVKSQKATNDRQITIDYEDEHGWIVGNSQIVSGKIGQTVNFDYQVPDGYSIDSTQQPAKTYTFKDKDNPDITVHVVTNKKMMPITIDYIDSSNNNTVGHQTIQGALNTTIQLNYQLPKGYLIDPKFTPDSSTYVTNINSPITVYVTKDPSVFTDRQVKLYLVNEHGWTIDSKTISGKVGQTVDINYTIPQGYTLDPSQKPVKSYTFKMADNPDITIHLIQNKQPATVNIEYIDLSNNKVVGHQAFSGNIGDTIDISYKAPDGYELDSSQLFIPRLYLNEKSQTLHCYVIKNDSLVKDSHYTINYIDDENNNIGQQILSGKPGQQTDINYKLPDGYTLKPGQQLPKVHQFGNADESFDVHVTSPQKKATVTVHYINSQTQSEVGSETYTGELNKPMDLQFHYPNNFKADTTKATSTHITPQTATSDVNVYVVPVENVNNNRTLTIHYKDGNKDIGTQTINGVVDQTISIDYQIPNGYKVVDSNTLQNEFTFNKDGNTDLTVNVTPDAQDTNRTIHIQYMNGNKRVGSQELSGKIGQAVTISYAIPNGYKVTDMTQLQKAYTFTDKNNKDIIIQVQEDKPVETRSIHINYVDDHGKTIKSTPITGELGSTVPINYSVPDGYHRIDGDQLPTQVTFAKTGNQDITVNIAKDLPENPVTKQTIHIRYVDGQKELKTDTLTGSPNQTVNVEYNAPDGYNIINLASLPKSYTFKDTNNNDIIVNIAHNIQDQHIHINYMDGNTLIKSDELSGKPGETVNVAYNLPSGYQEIAGQQLPQTYAFKQDGNKDIIVQVQKTSTKPETKRTRLTIEYLDQNNKLVGQDVLYGNQNSTIPVTYNIPTGYKLDPNQNLPKEYTLSQTGQDLTVKVVKDTQPVTPTNPETPSTPTKPNTPSTPAKPDTPSTPNKLDTPSTPNKLDTPSTPAENPDTNNSDNKAVTGSDNTDNGQTDVNPDTDNTSTDINNDKKDNTSLPVTKETGKTSKNDKQDAKSKSGSNSNRTNAAPAKSDSTQGSRVANGNPISNNHSIGRLPQTGNENPAALIAGALVAAMSLLALGYDHKHKDDENKKKAN